MPVCSLLLVGYSHKGSQPSPAVTAPNNLLCCTIVLLTLSLMQVIVPLSLPSFDPYHSQGVVWSAARVLLRSLGPMCRLASGRPRLVSGSIFPYLFTPVMEYHDPRCSTSDGTLRPVIYLSLLFLPSFQHIDCFHYLFLYYY